MLQRRNDMINPLETQAGSLRSHNVLNSYLVTGIMPPNTEITFLLKRLLFAFEFKIAHISGQTFEVFKTSKVFKMST